MKNVGNISFYNTKIEHLITFLVLKLHKMYKRHKKTTTYVIITETFFYMYHVTKIIPEINNLIYMYYRHSL